jgi:hypothetical protein
VSGWIDVEMYDMLELGLPMTQSKFEPRISPIKAVILRALLTGSVAGLTFLFIYVTINYQISCQK